MSQEINLLNAALRPRRDWLGASSVALAAGGALALMLALYAYASGSAASAQRAQMDAQAALKAVQQEVQVAQAALAARVPNPALEAEAQQLKAALKQRGEVLRLAEDLSAQGSAGVAEVMRGFARQRMEGVWLTGFSVGPAGFDIHGRLLDPSLLPTYIRRLNAEPAFRGRSFAALDMQGVQPAAAAAAGSAPVQKVSAVEPPPVRVTEFFLRASLPAKAAAGGKE